VSHQKNRTKTE